MSSGGFATKGFEIHINGTADTTFNLVSGRFTQTTTNIDFSSGDYLHMYVVDDGGGGAEVDNPAVILWVKWRK